MAGQQPHKPPLDLNTSSPITDTVGRKGKIGKLVTTVKNPGETKSQIITRINHTKLQNKPGISNDKTNFKPDDTNTKPRINSESNNSNKLNKSTENNNENMEIDSSTDENKRKRPADDQSPSPSKDLLKPKRTINNIKNHDNLVNQHNNSNPKNLSQLQNIIPAIPTQDNTHILPDYPPLSLHPRQSNLNLHNKDQQLPTYDAKTDTNKHTVPLQFDITNPSPYKIYIQSGDSKNQKVDAIKIAKMLIPQYPEKDTFLEIRQLSFNKVCVIMKYRNAANSVVNWPEWEKHNLRAFIPNHLLTRQGIIKGIPTYVTDEELKDFIELESPLGPLEVTHVRRLTKRVFNNTTDKLEILPTQTVQFTVKGQSLPSEAKVLKVIHPVEIYYPQIRQCYKCFRFGHIKINCKAPQEKCIRCGEIKHQKIEDCPNADKQPVCLHCQRNHLPTDKFCPKRIEEQQIKDTATKYNVSIAEVKLRQKKKKSIYTQRCLLPSKQACPRNCLIIRIAL